MNTTGDYEKRLAAEASWLIIQHLRPRARRAGKPLNDLVSVNTVATLSAALVFGFIERRQIKRFLDSLLSQSN